MFLQPQPCIRALKLARGLKAMPGEKVFIVFGYLDRAYGKVARDGLEALREVAKVDPNADEVMCRSMGQQTLIVEAIKSGAKDFITKPQNVIQALVKHNMRPTRSPSLYGVHTYSVGSLTGLSQRFDPLSGHLRHLGVVTHEDPLGIEIEGQTGAAFCAIRPKPVSPKVSSFRFLLMQSPYKAFPFMNGSKKEPKTAGFGLGKLFIGISTLA
jgi:CheY-like chemotaxis protein